MSVSKWQMSLSEKSMQVYMVFHAQFFSESWVSAIVTSKLCVCMCVYVTAAGCASMLTVPPNQTHLTSSVYHIQNDANVEHLNTVDRNIFYMLSIQMFEWITLKFSIWLPFLFEILFHICRFPLGKQMALQNCHGES